MIKYMVIETFKNSDGLQDSMIVDWDFRGIQDAEDLREEFLKINPEVDPLNVHVVQYKE